MATKDNQKWIQSWLTKNTKNELTRLLEINSDTFSFEKILAENIIAKN
jgi:hypothetical protein